MDSKYCSENFSESSVSDAKILSAELEKVVLSRIHEIVDRELHIVVEELNSLGHSLASRSENKTGDIGFIEEDGLRLNVDIIVSSGYDDLL